MDGLGDVGIQVGDVDKIAAASEGRAAISRSHGPRTTTVALNPQRRTFRQLRNDPVSVTSRRKKTAKKDEK
jgi:hypothetical protein